MEESQANFTLLVKTLLKNPDERKHFFQEVFPVRYGSKFDCALQALIGGLVLRLEQLLPMPDISQIGAMIICEPAIFEACGQCVLDPEPFNTLLDHQKCKGLLTKYAISSNVGDCVLSSLSIRPTTVEPPEQPAAQPAEQPASFEPYENAPKIMSPSSISDSADQGAMSDDLANRSGVDLNENVPKPNGGDHKESLQQNRGTDDVSPTKCGILLNKENLQLHPEVSSTSVATSLVDVSAGNCSFQNKPQFKRVTLHQWVSQIAINSVSLPVLPPLIFASTTQMNITSGNNYLKSVGTGGESPIKRQKTPYVREGKRKVNSVAFSCGVCGKSFHYASLLEDHQRMHTGEKPYKCTACLKDFRTSGLLSTHQKTHNNVRPFSCDECSRHFLKKADLQKHMRVHTGEKPFKCTICEKGFTQSYYYKVHMECHTSNKSFPCSHCEKSFPTAFKLSVHKKWHTVERPYMCERCGKTFLVPSLLKRHMGYHIGDRQFLCSQCGRTFVYMYDLKKHQRDHSPKPKLPCPTCQKVFSSKGCLKVHMRTHSSERPHTCNICHKGFTQIGNLRIHEKFHSNERPYRCDLCGKTYKISTHLNAHKITHSDVKPWTCSTCGKGFRYPGVLRKHEKIHSGERTENTRRLGPNRKCNKPSTSKIHDGHC